MSTPIVLSSSVFPRKLTREALFIVLLRIWFPQRMKRLLKKPRRQKGIRGRKTAFDNVCPLSVASKAARKRAMAQRHTAGS